MQAKKTAPYGTWKSPISAELIASSSNYIFETSLDENGEVFWLERRAKEQGHYVIMRLGRDRRAIDVIPTRFNARTRVHEYGGGSYTVFGNAAYFSNFTDQRLYRQDISDTEIDQPRQITHQSEVFYADLLVDKSRKRIICVREDHTVKGREAKNTIASVDLEGKSEEQILVSGNDFYSSPKLSPDEKKLAWLTWNHPSMPFFGTELWVGDVLKDGTIGQKQKIAGGFDESISEPTWSPNGIIHFVSDRSGWWNLYRFLDGKIDNLHEMNAEFTRPQWVFGMSSYAFASEEQIVCTYTQDGTWHLATLDTKMGTLREIKTPYSEFQYLKANHKFTLLVAGSPSLQSSVVRFDLDTKNFALLYPTTGTQSIPSGCVSLPEAVDFPTTNGLTSHGIFYAPKNEEYESPKNEQPPLMVISHGGPTSATRTTLNPEIQYWTSRGFAVLDVNYGGSTGYGREYRMRLNGQWGVVDVDDCANGALFLASSGRVDEKRLIIRGGSAGGYTTLCALAFRKTFKAGASYFGVSDIELLARDTHKFESRYFVSLIGPYPEKKELYRERSPINYAKDISAPVIFFQGLEDKVVPPNQAELMFDAVRKKGIPTAYLTFEGEQHGFRQAKNIKRANESELYFYSKVFGFELADQIEPVKIENIQLR